MKTGNKSISLQSGMFYLLLLLGLGWVIYTYRILFGPLITSSLIAYLLYPVVNWISSHTNIKRQRVVIMVFVIFLILTSLAVAFLAPSVITQANLLSKQLQNLPDQLDTIAVSLSQSFDLTLPLDDIVTSLESDIEQMLKPEKIFRVLLASTTNIVWVVVVAVTVFHLLRDWEQLREWIFGFAPGDQQTEYRRLHAEIKNIWQSYLRGQLLIMFLLGLLSGIGSAAVGLPNALLLGILAGTLALIPNLGPAIATAIAGLVAWTQGSSYLEISNLGITLIAIAIFQVAQLIEGFWLTPRIMSRRMKLHPGVVLLAIIGTLFTLGALMALIIVPTIGSIVLIIQFFNKKQAGLDPWPQNSPLVGSGKLPEGEAGISMKEEVKK